MTYERLVGLNVENEAVYQDYRDAMSKILVTYGGEFSYDFKIAAVLTSPAEENFNRVFILRFPDQSSMEQFFSNQDYLDVREKYFIPSVSHTKVIATYES